MAKNNELDEFGFEPVEEQDADLAEFGFEASDAEVPMSTEEESTMSPELKQVLGVGTGAAIGKGAEMASQKVGNKLTDMAEDFAYVAAGGDTAPGKKFLKKELEKIGDVGKSGAITTKSLGRRALNEGLVDIFQSSGKAFDKAEDAMLEAIRQKKDLISGTKSKGDWQEVGKQFWEDINTKTDKNAEGQAAQRRLDYAEKELEMMGKGEVDVPRLEKAKIEAQKKIMPSFDQNRAPLKGAEFESTSSKAKVYKQAVEDIIAKEGEDALEKFKGIKKDIGERGILRDLTLNKHYRDLTDPTVSFKDIGMTGVAGPGAALAHRGFKKKGASIGAKLSDLMGKIAKSKATKALPYVGAGIGMLATYNEAKAAGEPTSEAIKQAVAEEGVETVLGPAAGIVLPERSGPRKDSLQYKLESGQKLTPQEYKQLFPQAAQSLQQSDSPAAKALGDELAQAKETGGESYNQKMYQIQQQPALRELLRRRAKKNQSEASDEMMTSVAESVENAAGSQEPNMSMEEDTQGIEEAIDRVNQQQSSGENVPMSQLDNLLGMIDSLQVSPEVKDELEMEATNMVGYRDGERLKEMLRKLRS